MSQPEFLVIVRYGEPDPEGFVSREGVRCLQALSREIAAQCVDPVQVFFLDIDSKPYIRRSARVLAADFLKDPDLVTPLSLAEGGEATNVKELLELLHAENPTIVVVVDSAMSGSLAELCTKGWPDDCVHILDSGHAHVLNLREKTHFSL